MDERQEVCITYCFLILREIKFPRNHLPLSCLTHISVTKLCKRETECKRHSLFPPQLPSEPPPSSLLQCMLGNAMYSQTPNGPHYCQLVTECYWDSCLTAPAKQEKWAQQGARGLPFFFHKKYLSQQGFLTAAPTPHLHTSIHMCVCILCSIVRTLSTGDSMKVDLLKYKYVNILCFLSTGPLGRKEALVTDTLY